MRFWINKRSNSKIQGNAEEDSGIPSRVSSLKGVWEIYSVDNSTCQSSGSLSKESRHELLSANVQDINVDGDRLVISTLNGSKRLELDVNGETQDHVKCVVQGSEDTPLRMEYETPRGRVIDERRVFRNGTRLEQRLSIVPSKSNSADSQQQVLRQQGEPVVERRFFKRRDTVAKTSRQSFWGEQKIRLLSYLLLSQIPLMLFVPSRVWGSFLCAFHTVALFLVMFWSPRSQASVKDESSSSLSSTASVTPASKTQLTCETNKARSQSFVTPRKVNIPGPITSHGRSTSIMSTTSTTSTMSLSSLQDLPSTPLTPLTPTTSSMRHIQLYHSLRLSSQGTTTPSIMSPELLQKFKDDQILDVVVSISQVRKRKKGLTTFSEFELLVRVNPQVEAAGGPKASLKEWMVWHRYASIVEFHRVLEKLLETDETRHSIFTRVVPPIPLRGSGGMMSATRSRRRYEDLLRRRMAGLEEFFVRVLGPEANPEIRYQALKDQQVQRFLGIDSQI
mmetsp:Transcript_5624/g.11525  ORF Transcript_5624/g.11525 Transcript_5624/m.11525 type:complete len:506 (-) Transcript_5624:248-1765(-)|eukprot:CAMPEP_0171489516 /NCGR_PEP_ID=MMETSP0958-20121227/2801_1 /TAXON_ID=87120 /ORGANISM="Aurantiochytrium limacinum, Strain ATCCMYA-1381" /LENGTH=505 /DNA_ID=CAMNT_0012022739 /DNA_START=901 /DNA_END=2418 /DNA_ORIENTATION=+